MILLRFRNQFEDLWTHAALDGEDEEQAAGILAARLSSLDFEVEVGEDDEFIPLEESSL